MNYDLHSHSTASDGTLSPRDLVLRAAVQGVTHLALTDHDVTSGLAEAEAAAAEAGITLVPGVEISVTWSHQILHIVGLGVAAAHPDLQQGLATLRERRNERAIEMGRRLEKKNIDAAYAGALKYAGGAVISRTHFARYLVEAGHARNMNTAFNKYLKRGKPGYAPCVWAELAEAVSWINAAGGQAVIAHPGRYKLSAGRFRALLDEFKECGGVGLEVISGTQAAADLTVMANYAKRYGLLASAGSDYHGPGQSYTELGRLPALPPTCRPIWDEWPLPCLARRTASA